MTRSRRLVAEMNVVPFIDVMLVLLVIFMITAPLLTQGVNVNLPQTAAQALSDQQKEPIIVTVDAHGQFYLNVAQKPQEPLAARALQHLLLTQFSLATEGRGPSTRAILVRGDKAANYGKIIEAMVLLKKAGANSVGLVTEPTDTHAFSSQSKLR